MCDKKNATALRNGHAGDPVTQGHAIADIVDAVSEISERLKEIPTRKEVFAMLENNLKVHIESCEHARRSANPPQRLPKSSKPSRFKLWKGGLEAEGVGGILLGLALGLSISFLIYVAVPYLSGWLETCLSK